MKYWLYYNDWDLVKWKLPFDSIEQAVEEAAGMLEYAGKSRFRIEQDDGVVVMNEQEVGDAIVALWVKQDEEDPGWYDRHH